MILRCLENVPLMLVLCVFIYHVVVNVITMYTLVKLAKSHYLLLSFVCILYIVFVCLFKLFVCTFNFLLPLVVNKDVHKKCKFLKSKMAEFRHVENQHMTSFFFLPRAVRFG